MVAVLDYTVFAMALTGAVWAIVVTLAPAMPRIVALLSGRGDPVAAAGPRLTVNPPRHSARLRPMPAPARPAAVLTAAA